MASGNTVSFWAYNAGGNSHLGIAFAMPRATQSWWVPVSIAGNKDISEGNLPPFFMVLRPKTKGGVIFIFSASIVTKHFGDLWSNETKAACLNLENCHAKLVLSGRFLLKFVERICYFPHKIIVVSLSLCQLQSILERSCQVAWFNVSVEVWNIWLVHQQFSPFPFHYTKHV